MATRPIAELSLETQVIVERLGKAAVGDLVTYQELRDLTGLDVQHDGRGVMESARRICQRDSRMVFGAVMNEGLKRLDDQGIVGTGGVTLKRIGRAARRGVRTLGCVKDFDALPESARVEHNMSVSVLGALGQMTKRNKLEQVRLAVSNAQTKLPLARTLEMFVGKAKAKE